MTSSFWINKWPSFDFQTKQGEPTGVSVTTSADLTGATLTLLVDSNSKFETPTALGTVSWTNGSIVMNFTKDQVNQIRDSYYRVQAQQTINGQLYTYYVLGGSIDYRYIMELESEDLLDDDGRVRARYQSAPVIIRYINGAYQLRPSTALMAIFRGPVDPGKLAIDGDLWVAV